MKGEADDDFELLAEAEEWDRRIAQGSPAQLEAFACWLRTSPRHVNAYLMQTALRVELADVDADRELDLERTQARVAESK